MKIKPYVFFNWRSWLIGIKVETWFSYVADDGQDIVIARDMIFHIGPIQLGLEFRYEEEEPDSKEA